MTPREKIFIGLIALALIAICWLAWRPQSTQISPAPSAPLPTDDVGESNDPGSQASAPEVAAVTAEFPWPMQFMPALPVTSTGE